MESGELKFLFALVVFFLICLFDTCLLYIDKHLIQHVRNFLCLYFLLKVNLVFTLKAETP